MHFFIVKGTPHSGNPDTECFNPIVDTLGFPEILGANIHEKIYRWPWINKERAYAQLVSKLLGVEFDAIWQRHKRLLIRKTVFWMIGVIAVVAALIGVWVKNQPVEVEVRLNETSVQNAYLPPLKNAVVTMTLDNETKTDTIHSLESRITFTNIPNYYINNKVRVMVICQDFIDVDTTIMLTKEVVLNISRNPSVYGNIRFRLWNTTTEKVVSNTKVMIAGQTVISDDDGRVSLFVPLDSQRKAYTISASIPLVSDTIYLPCGPDDVIIYK